MTELEELKRQKKEIEKRIKELTCQQYAVDGAKMANITRRGVPTEGWEVRLQELLFADKSFIDNTPQYKRVVYARSKEDCIAGIRGLIDSLNDLHREVTGDSYLVDPEDT